jgi:hypothetical protein
LISEELYQPERLLTDEAGCSERVPEQAERVVRMTMLALAIRDEFSPEELRRQARHVPDGRVSARLMAIANALDGMDRSTAARLAGTDGQILRDWVRRYNAEGIGGLFNRKAPGPRPQLSEGQMAALKARVLAGPDPAGDGVALAGRRSVPMGGGALGRALQRDRDAAPVVVARPVAPKGPAAASAER